MGLRVRQLGVGLALAGGVACTTTSAPGGCSRADIGNRGLYYCTRGTGHPTIVLEADRGMDHRLWDSVAARLGRYTHVITYDRAGLGQSDPTGEPRTIASVAGDLDRLLAALGERGPLVLVGHRYGGWYLRTLAANRPSLVKDLVLIDSPPEDFEVLARQLLSDPGRRQLDSAEAAIRASLAEPARREWDGLVGERPAIDVGIPTILIRSGTHALPIPRSPPALEGLWRQLHDDSLGRLTLNAQIVDLGPPIHFDRPDSLVAVIKGRTLPAGVMDTSREHLPEIFWGLVKHWVELTLAGIGGLFLLGWRLATRRVGDRQLIKQYHRNPEAIHLWELIPKTTPPADQPVALLRACNERARQLYVDRVIDRRPKDSSPDDIPFRKRLKMWESAFAEIWPGQRTFVAPVCDALDRDGSVKSSVDGVATIVGWLRDCLPSNSLAWSGQVWVKAVGGAGKTTLINRLYFRLVGAVGGDREPTAPEPMLASARNVSRFRDDVDRLRGGPDHFRSFVTLWLDNRGIDRTPEATETLVREFRRSCEAGRVVLLLDGHDEMRHLGLEAWLADLRAASRWWVCAERSDYDASGGIHDRTIRLGSDWTIGQIGEHLAKRWPNDRRACQDVQSILEEAIGTEPGAWLSLPRNLDLLLSDLAPGGEPKLPSKDELRRRAGNEPYFFQLILDKAIERLNDPEAAVGPIRDRLFEIAALHIREHGYQLTADEEAEPTWKQVIQLTELISRNGAVVTFRKDVFRDYFAAGRIAWELAPAARKADPGVDLLALKNDPWSRAKLTSVAGWLRQLEPVDPARRIRARLPRIGSPAGPDLDATMIRNLVDLLIRVELDQLASADEAERDRRRRIALADFDFEKFRGDDIDLSLLRIEGCSFTGAALSHANLMHARFDRCRFERALLSKANAVGAEFLHCRFGAVGAEPAVVDDMEIESAVFRLDDSTPITDVGPAELEQRGASLKHSRYRGEFGRKFFEAQRVFLGEALEHLERDCYLPAISKAIEQWQDQRRPIYLVDLMAGGGADRMTALRARYPDLRVLGIDRDETTQPTDERFKWAELELGADSPADSTDLTVDLPKLIATAFGSQAGPVDVIVAKKALHELPRRLQASLLRRSFEALRPGGRLVLFVDTPGDPKVVLDPAATQAVTTELESLRAMLCDSQRQVAEIRKEALGRTFTDDRRGQATFSNTWIMLKDWANHNQHEVRNRYFASLAEIRDWARPWFGEPTSIVIDHYRLNPKIFNEVGIQNVLHHLERNGKPEDYAEIVARDLPTLTTWIAGDGAFRVLLDFTTRNLGPAGGGLGSALGAALDRIDLRQIDPALKPLNPPEPALSFQLPCAVLVFEKPR